jgi:GNAT superfamily N-acetyltransferase
MIRQKLIRDRSGRVLKFTQERKDELVYFRLEYRQACAACANCRIDGDVLWIADLFVQDKFVISQSNIFKRLLGRKTINLNFRRQGFGSQLLATIIAYARSKGLKRIEGRMVADQDSIPDPKLPKWFQKRGFTVEESLVSMDLTKPSGQGDDSRYMPK